MCSECFLFLLLRTKFLPSKLRTKSLLIKSYQLINSHHFIPLCSTPHHCTSLQHTLPHSTIFYHHSITYYIASLHNVTLPHCTMSHYIITQCHISSFAQCYLFSLHNVMLLIAQCHISAQCYIASAQCHIASLHNVTFPNCTISHYVIAQ